MISVAAISSAGGAAGYYAGDNYYTADEHGETSAWAGRGSAELGLSGPVNDQAFERVLEGELPDSTTIDAKRGEHRPGWDLTMSASKSVSLLASVGGDRRLTAAVRGAALSTLAWVEKNLAEGRATKGGVQRSERTGNLVAALFMHDVNRAEEPQLHGHGVIANATRTSDGKWHALRSDELYKRQHVIGAVFNAELRSRVEALGYATTPAANPRDGSFEIAGVSRGVIEAFSVRSAQIEAYLQQHGLQGTPAERDLAARATRLAKAPTLSPEERGQGWAALARAEGLEAGKLVAAALARSGRGQTVWAQAMTGVRGAGAKGMALVARMGLTPRDDDPLVPERAGRLDPRAYAAAQAVASAARDLGEREAAFDRLDLVRAALERGGPVTVADVEARLALLEGKGLLVGDGDRMVTTEGAVQLERSYLDQVEAGVGRSAPIVSAGEAGARAQDAARELGLRRLNAGQEAAATLILSSPDRVVNVQGGPGRGKSAALAPVVAIARAEGRAVIGLAIASRTARTLGRETGAEASTVAGFLARHARVIDGTALPEQAARAQAELAGAVMIVEEASQVGTHDLERLVRLANVAGAARLVQVGDTRQLGAVNAGKPFEQSQAAGHATAHITENLRSASEQMKAVTAALDRGDVPGTFAVLAPATIEVARGEQAGTAAKMWAALPRAERDATLLLASGRAMRAAANAAAQAELKRAGELTGKRVRLEVLDRVTITREGARRLGAYAEGRVVELRTDLPTQKLTRGERGVVVAGDGQAVRLRMRSGEVKTFRPDKLPRNLQHDAVSVYAVKEVTLHPGDRIRWTDNDRDRGLLNADLARVEEVGGGRLVVSSLADGTVHELARGDRMLERLDLAYAVNVHVAQGVTTPNGIVAMDSRERNLNTARAFLVALTRIADRATLVVDDPAKLERAVSRNPGEKTSALEVAGRGGTPTQPSTAPSKPTPDNAPILLPDPHATEKAQLAGYARAFAAVETAANHNQWPERSDVRAMRDGADALDRLRPGGAEDLRSIIDRTPALAQADKLDPLWKAWVDEGRVRASAGPEHGDRFVADWRATLAERAAGSGSYEVIRRTGRKLTRLVERKDADPSLERALERSIPERQLKVDYSVVSRMRTREMDMGR